MHGPTKIWPSSWRLIMINPTNQYWYWNSEVCSPSLSKYLRSELWVSQQRLLLHPCSKCPVPIHGVFKLVTFPSFSMSNFLLHTSDCRVHTSNFAHGPGQVDWNPHGNSRWMCPRWRLLSKKLDGAVTSKFEQNSKAFLKTSIYIINGWPFPPFPWASRTPQQKLSPIFFARLPWMPVEVICHACPFLEPEIVAVPSPWGTTGRIGHKWHLCLLSICMFHARILKFMFSQ